ncbi:rho-associated protein kinase 2-like [Ruditapes philippinarum]|uniref:rho-associated protein kinase 2-like n=1 Tax=Ruditapes philippinarum TaxID=129788 RepID=UPI00295AA8FC|nr:rho-associated protein kinase 2-like [Ruditapes philippinarum]
MCIYKFLLQTMFVCYILMYTEANLSADAVYSMLAAKIDTINSEMSLLRQVLMSTKSELAFTQTKLKSTETEVNMIKRQCGLISGITTNTRSPITPTENSTSTSFEDETCCQVVEKAIIRMKAEQKQTKQDIENVIEKKVAKVNEGIARNSEGLVSMETKIDKLAVDLVSLRNNSDKQLVKMGQEAKVLIEEMASYNLEIVKTETKIIKTNNNLYVISRNLDNLTQQIRNEMKDIKKEISNNTLDLKKLERNLEKEAENLQELSNNHEKLSMTVEQQQNTFDKEIQNKTMCQIKTRSELEKLSSNLNDLTNNHARLAETVQDQSSQITKVVKSEMEKTEHCQSGHVRNWNNDNPFPITFTITFKKPFTNTPAFTMGASMLDFYKDRNLRLSLTVKELSNKQAKVHATVWADTKISGAGFHWMACPT